MKRDLVSEDLERARQELSKKSDKELEEESIRSERFKKRFIKVLTVFLVLLMLSFLYLGYPVYNYVFGLAGSSRMDVNNEVTFKKEVVVSFDEDVILFLQSLYDPLGDERAVCLLGEINNNEYVVRDYYKPVVFDRAWNRVSHVPCSDDAIIMLHTHPLKRCNPSTTDENTLRATQYSNPEIIMLVMCGSRRFSAVI